MTDSQTDPAIPLERNSALSNSAVGAVIALIRVAELYDPSVAHRCALRAIVASRLMTELAKPQTADQHGAHELTSHPSIVIATAALSDIDLAITRPADPEASSEPTRSLLSSTLVGNLVGLDAVGSALEYQRERFDGAGETNGLEGDRIPLAARISAVADCLVGNPTSGFVPSWYHARRRVKRQSGHSLDPKIVSALETIELEDINAPLVASSTVQGLLDAAVEPADDDEPLATTTISEAISRAASPTEVVAILSKYARRLVNATEIVVLASSQTQLDQTPVARIDDSTRPLLPLSRLADIFEFSTQAELRTGASLERSSMPNTEIDAPAPIDEIVSPIMLGADMWGLLVATRREGLPPFTPTDQKTLSRITSEMAAAVATSSHWAEMERMALRDQLTGIGNRHCLYRVLDRIFQRPAVERTDTALIMCDVDGLKVINDTLGHQEGDRLLIDAAAALRGAVRDPDTTTVCRIGGDEFCMVIDRGALLSAHEISNTIERLFERSAGSGPARSISCGIAFADESVSSRSELLRAADENQYEKKRARKARQQQEVLAIGTGDSEASGRRANRD